MDALMIKLDAVFYIALRKIVPYDTPCYQRLLTFFREEFLRAVQIPHSPDYLNAMAMTDYAPEVLDHGQALARLLRADPLHAGEERDLADDRYLLELSPSERMLAGLANLYCAEYLLIKRMFFKDFYLHIHRRHAKAKARSGMCDVRCFLHTKADVAESRRKRSHELAGGRNAMSASSGKETRARMA
jgi:hypothetical protein